MNAFSRSAMLSIALALAAGCPWARAAEPPAADKPIVWPGDQLPFKEMIPGISRVVLEGDPDKGQHTTITKFQKGHKNPLHTHTHGEWLVVVSGTFIEDLGDGPKKLGPGSFIYEPPGAKHANGAGDDADCVFVERSDGAFDLHWFK